MLGFIYITRFYLICKVSSLLILIASPASSNSFHTLQPHTMSATNPSITFRLFPNHSTHEPPTPLTHINIFLKRFSFSLSPCICLLTTSSLPSFVYFLISFRPTFLHSFPFLSFPFLSFSLGSFTAPVTQFYEGDAVHVGQSFLAPLSCRVHRSSFGVVVVLLLLLQGSQ